LIRSNSMRAKALFVPQKIQKFIHTQASTISSASSRASKVLAKEYFASTQREKPAQLPVGNRAGFSKPKRNERPNVYSFSVP
jgi:hypothetical protein